MRVSPAGRAPLESCTTGLVSSMPQRPSAFMGRRIKSWGPQATRFIVAAQSQASDKSRLISQLQRHQGHVIGSPPDNNGTGPQGGAAAGQQAGPDISRLPPLLQQQWDHPKNAHLGNIVITPGSSIRVWWSCDKCPLGLPHKWLVAPSPRTSGHRSGCPYCAGRRVCDRNSLPAQDPTVAAQWSSNNTDKPESYTTGSNVKKMWVCQQCGHEWRAKIISRTSAKQGCPKCANIKRKTHQQRPPVTESQHAMAHWDWELNDQAGLHPSKLTCGSGKKAHWVCQCCPKGQLHRWTAVVHSVALRESGCPCCRGLVACVCNSLQSLHPAVAAAWDYNRNSGTPADYAASSNKMMWWHNSTRGSFQATIESRTREKGLRGQQQKQSGFLSRLWD